MAGNKAGSHRKRFVLKLLFAAGNQRLRRVEGDHNRRQCSGYANLFAQLPHQIQILSSSITDCRLQHVRKSVEILQELLDSDLTTGYVIDYGHLGR